MNLCAIVASDQKIIFSAQRRVEVDLPALLAPMSGVTDVAFRRIARRFGAGLVVSEMVAADGLARGEAESALRAEGAGIAPHVVQIAGCDAHWMAEGARIAEATGAAAIDINMGCPAKRVTGGWSGSALMRDLDHATALIAATVAAVSIPVSVKMRLGWDHQSLNAPALAARARDLGVGMVTVHGRTRQQFYKGQADWRAVAAVREAFDGYLVVNGDIHREADARQALDQSGADAVMVGRAAVGRPWLVGEIGYALAGHAAPAVPDDAKNEAASEHYDALLTLYGREVGLRHARKHLAAYADEAARLGSAYAAASRQRLVTSTDCAEVAGLLSRLFRSDVPERAAA